MVPTIFNFAFHRTINYNIARALPFYANQTASNLLALRPGQPVGNWRDSNQGLGYGTIPFDVNTALVPANLRATAALADAGIIAQPQLDMTGTNSTNTTNFTVADIAAAWESAAPALFEVVLDPTIAESRLNNFVTAANLSQALLSNSSGTNSSSSNTTGTGNSTTTGNSTSTGNVTFYALSLNADGSAVQVSITSFPRK